MILIVKIKHVVVAMMGWVALCTDRVFRRIFSRIETSQRIDLHDYFVSKTPNHSCCIYQLNQFDPVMRGK